MALHGQGLNNCSNGATPVCSQEASTPVSGTPLKIAGNGGLTPAFNYSWSGSPTGVTTTISGCMINGITADTCTSLDSYSGSTTTNRTSNQFSVGTPQAAYNYYLITSTWTGSSTFTVYGRITTSRNANSGSGASLNVAQNWTAPQNFIEVNNVIYADQGSGVDAFAKINAAYAALPSAGGVVDATGFGCTSQTVTTQGTWGSRAKPVFVKFNPCTHFILNQTAGTPAVLLGNGSIMDCEGTNVFQNSSGNIGGFFTSATTNISWIIAPALTDGTQQNYIVKGCGFEGSASQTVTGGMILIQGLFAGTLLRDIALANCFGIGLQINPGTTQKNVGDIVIDNSNIGCSGTAGSRPVLIDALNSTSAISRITFIGGAIQNAGSGQHVFEINGQSSVQCQGVRTVGTDFETSASSADMGLITDCHDVQIDASVVTGNVGTATNEWTIAEVGSHTTYNIEIYQARTLTSGGFPNLINNTIAGAPCNTPCTGTSDTRGNNVMADYRYGRIQPEIVDAIGTAANPVTITGTATSALSLAPVYDSVNCGATCLNQNATIALTTMVPTGSIPTGGAAYEFLVQCSQVDVGVGCTGNSTLTVQIKYTDFDANSGAGYLNNNSMSGTTWASVSPTFSCTLTNGTQGQANIWKSYPWFVSASNATAIQFGTVYTPGSGCTTNPHYSIRPVLRLLNTY